MAVKLTCAFVICGLAAALAADSSWDNAGVRVALKVYDECSKAEGFTPCLKKKALTYLNRLSRLDKLPLTEGIIVVRSDDKQSSDPVVTDEQLENDLPGDRDARNAALDTMLYEKLTSFVSSRTLQVTMPKISITDLGLDEGRGKKMKGMFGGMMMGIMGKMAALIPIAIAGLFLLAGKALITAKIALLLAGIIALKKLVAAKNGGGGGGGHGGGHGGGWQNGGGGWQSSGGGWDRRSLDSDQTLPYKAYAPK